eukprot:11170304-Lingulodinium_polyedra.AAC.1
MPWPGATGRTPGGDAWRYRDFIDIAQTASGLYQRPRPSPLPPLGRWKWAPRWGHLNAPRPNPRWERRRALPSRRGPA